MSRVSASWVLLLAGLVAGGCSSVASSVGPRDVTQWSARQQTIANLPASDAASRTFVFAGQACTRTVTFGTGSPMQLLRVDNDNAVLGKGVQEVFFSPDGRHYAYAGQLGDRRVAVVDGQSRLGPSAHSEMTLSDDSRHLAYIASVNGADCAIVDGQVHASRGFARSPIIFSSSARHWAYPAADQPKGGKEYMVIDGIKGPAYDRILSCQYQGDDLYYTAQRGQDWYMISPAGPGKPCESVSFLFVSPNGRHRGWLAVEERRKTVVVQTGRCGQAHFPCDSDMDLLALSDDGQAICRAGTPGNYQLVMGERRLPADGLPIAAIASRAGRHVAAVVCQEHGRNVSQGVMETTQTQHVELDGKRQPDYLVVRGLTFSPDGTHLAYWGMRSDLRWALVADGQETEIFDSLPLGLNRNWTVPVMSPAPITFDGEHTLSALGINDNQLVRLTLTAQ